LGASILWLTRKRGPDVKPFRGRSFLAGWGNSASRELDQGADRRIAQGEETLGRGYGNDEKKRTFPRYMVIL
jgi:hypothetical protein